MPLEMLEEVAEIFKALGNISRLKILLNLYEGRTIDIEQMASEFKMTPSSVYKHLKVLLDRGMIISIDKEYKLSQRGSWALESLVLMTNKYINREYNQRLIKILQKMKQRTQHPQMMEAIDRLLKQLYE